MENKIGTRNTSHGRVITLNGRKLTNIPLSYVVETAVHRDASGDYTAIITSAWYGDDGNCLMYEGKGGTPTSAAREAYGSLCEAERLREINTETGTPLT